MSRFEYNFTRESQFEELRDRNRQLNQENQSLKQSLEDLIKVNTELTESIQQFNNSNNYQQQNSDELEKRLTMLLNENQKLKRELEEETQKNGSINKQSQINDKQTESLVNVLEELIQSFKDIENKYESDIAELQKSNQTNSKNFQNMLKKLEQQLNSKVSTVEALSIQLKRKDEILSNIEEQFVLIEKSASRQTVVSKQPLKNESNEDKIKLEAKIDSVNKQLEQKDRIIKIYQKLISNLKGKIMQKY